MFYKTLILVSFAIFFGMNTALAQEEPCICIDEISAAVENVMATSGCDEAMLWEAPKALQVHLAKLQNWCGAQNKPLKSKIPNIVEGMLETSMDFFIILTGLVFNSYPKCSNSLLRVSEASSPVKVPL